MNRARFAGAVLVLVTAAALATVGLGVVTPNVPSATPAPSVTPSSSSSMPPIVSQSTPVARVDSAYDPAIVRTPTAEKPQSKLWFNDGIWWGVLFDPASGQFHIDRLDWATQRWTDTGTFVDERPFARMDCLWDGTHLYVVSAGSRTPSSHAARLTRYGYDPVLERYTPDADFPVAVTSGGVDGIVLAKDSTGQLWVTYIADTHLYVNRSLGSDVVWGQPFIPPVSGTTVAADQAAIVSLPDRVGVMWSNQGEESLYFATHLDGAPDTEWRQTSTVVSGLANVDDHISIKAIQSDGDGRVFAAIKTSLDTLPNRSPLAAQVVLVVLEPDGSWRSYLFGRVKEKHTRPIVLIDEEHRVVYVIAASPFPGGAIYYKASSLDQISFATGEGTPLIGSGEFPRLNNATSTKQNLTSQTGLLVLASDDATGRYVHAALGLGGPSPGSGVARLVPSAAPAPTVLLDQTFDPWPAGSSLPMAWRPPGPTARGIAALVELAPGNRALRLTNGLAAGSVSTCARFVPVTSGTVRATADIVVSAHGKGDAGLTTIGKPGASAAAVRLGGSGTLAYFDGERRVKTSARYRLRTWYRSIVVVHLDRRTYDWEIGERGASRPILSVRDVPWRSRTASIINELCVSTPPDVVRGSLTIDNVRVEH